MCAGGLVDGGEWFIFGRVSVDEGMAVWWVKLRCGLTSPQVAS